MGLYVAWKVVWSTALPVGFCTQCPGLGIHSSGSLWDSRPTVKHKPQRPLCARPAMSSGLPVCWAPPTQLLSCPVMGLCKQRLLRHDCFKCSVDAVVPPYLCICIYFATFWLGLGYMWFNKNFLSQKLDMIMGLVLDKDTWIAVTSLPLSGDLNHRKLWHTFFFLPRLEVQYKSRMKSKNISVVKLPKKKTKLILTMWFI